MKCTIRQEKFVASYLVSGNGAQAARSAGYSPRTSRQQASRLLTKVNISIAIIEKRAEAARITELSLPSVVGGLLAAIEQAQLRADAKAQIAGWETIAKLLNFYPQKNKKGKCEIDPADPSTWPDELLRAKLQ